MQFQEQYRRQSAPLSGEMKGVKGKKKRRREGLIKGREEKREGGDV